jgi:hypothetical protein
LPARLRGVFCSDEVKQALKVGDRPDTDLDLLHAVGLRLLARRPAYSGRTSNQKAVLRRTALPLARFLLGARSVSVRIPADGDRGFQGNVNADSGGA